MRTWIAETWSRNPRNALGGEDHAGRAHSLPQDRAAKLRERAPKLELRYRDRGTGPDHGEAEPDGIEAAANPFFQVCQVRNVSEPIRGKTRKRLEIEQRHPAASAKSAAIRSPSAPASAEIVQIRISQAAYFPLRRGRQCGLGQPEYVPRKAPAIIGTSSRSSCSLTCF
jgi:hypothetical protein